MNKDKFVILSDIHANLTALKAVLSDIQAQGYLPDAVVILGDIINYGMRSDFRIKETFLPYSCKSDGKSRKGFA